MSPPQSRVTGLAKFGIAVQSVIAIAWLGAAVDGFAHEPVSWRPWLWLLMGLGWGGQVALTWRRAKRS
jgi:hypothetical protein